MATTESRLAKLEALRRVVKPALVLITFGDAELTEEQQEQKANAERTGQSVRLLCFRVVDEDYEPRLTHDAPWVKKLTL